jgi:archaellum component FlaC
MAGVAEGVISELITRGVEKIASRKKLTSQDLTVLLLHEQSRAIVGLERGMGAVEKGMMRMEKGMNTIANELSLLRQEIVPLLNQAKDVADIKARVERIEDKIG